MTRKTISKSSKKIKHKKITRKRIKELMSYDPNIGVFMWKVDLGCARAGNVAGYIGSGGHFYIGIDRGLYPVAKLAFLYMIGYFPKKPVEYLNGNKRDNRWVNIDDSLDSEDVSNILRYGFLEPLSIKDSSGVKGVHWSHVYQMWVSFVSVDNEEFCLGFFKNKDDAIHAKSDTSSYYRF